MPKLDRTARMNATRALSRRELLQATIGGAAVMAVPSLAQFGKAQSKGAVRIGLITDLHHDIMHDAPERMNAFLAWAKSIHVDGVMQLGDFAYPKAENKVVIDPFNAASGLHVIGNHDLDAGHSKEQCLETWGMPSRYYAKDLAGIRILVLDANESGSPDHGGGYVKYIGSEQQQWMEQQLKDHDGPFLIASHQPLAGPAPIDNSEAIQTLLGKYAEKIWLCINGHTHLDMLLRVQGVSYLHVNSASYKWVSGSFKHQSYPKKVHADHKWIEYTCPYRDPIFAALTLDPSDGSVTIEGRTGEWVGPSPAALGADRDTSVHHGEEIAPWIRSRRVERAAGSASWID